MISIIHYHNVEIVLCVDIPGVLFLLSDLYRLITRVPM